MADEQRSEYLMLSDELGRRVILGAVFTMVFGGVLLGLLNASVMLHNLLMITCVIVMLGVLAIAIWQRMVERQSQHRQSTK